MANRRLFASRDRWDPELDRLGKALRNLDHLRSRHGRRRARRRVFLRLAALRRTVDETYPPLPKLTAVRDPAEFQTWEEYEIRTIKHVKRRWDRQLAEEFNTFISARDQHAIRPITFDMRPNVTRFIGRHLPDRIQLHVGLSGRQKWRTLLHEIAHYRVAGHRRVFVRELAHVYAEWKLFLKTQRGAPTAFETTANDETHHGIGSNDLTAESVLGQ